MTDCNTPQEQIHGDLTLDEAVRLYQDSDRPDRRLGITKDAIATVVFGSGVTNPKVSGVHDQIQSEKKSHYRHSL